MTARFTLLQRLSAAFALLLLACCGVSAWLQVQSNTRHEQVVVQRLSKGLAAHIAESAPLMKSDVLDSKAVKSLFGKLMDVNPSVEVYLLSPDGRILGDDAPEGHLKRQRVDVAPIRRLLAGDALPIAGDDPRTLGARKVFSAAPLKVEGRDAGYVYVVLLGEEHDALAQTASDDAFLRTTLWSMALVAALGLLAGLIAFRWITRPLRRLTDEVHRFQAGSGARPEAIDPLPAEPPAGRDEIALLGYAFARMRHRIAEQWRELTAADQQRRELVANISHDLRTPLTSLHGYLETLRIKADTLSDGERLRYLDVALGQSRKVGKLAQELFELARLEYGVVEPDTERFSLADLVQDVFQKFELAAQARRQRLVARVPPQLPTVAADLGLIERVLTNLLDNAIRHTPEGGVIEVELRPEGDGVEVLVSDSGPGIPKALQETLFTRPSFLSGGAQSVGGLGLIIVRRILQLHGSDIRLVPRVNAGAVFQFQLPSHPA